MSLRNPTFSKRNRKFTEHKNTRRVHRRPAPRRSVNVLQGFLFSSDKEYRQWTENGNENVSFPPFNTKLDCHYLKIQCYKFLPANTMLLDSDNNKYAALDLVAHVHRPGLMPF
jgi:hypothetical protein